MLQATFQRLVRGVNAEKESKLWRQGVLSWDDLEKTWSPRQELFGQSDYTLDQSPFSVLRNALWSEDVSYFARVLDRKELFRIALAFPNRTPFLDIETTGLSRYYDYITLIGWCYQGRYNMVKAGVVIPLYHDELVSADGEMKPSPEVPDILTFAQLYEQINGRLPSGILWEALKIIYMTQLMQRFSRRLLLWSRTPNLSKTSRKLPSPLLDIKSRQKEKSREEMSTAACLGTDPLELSRAAIQ